MNISTSAPSAQEFFEVWKRVCERRTARLLEVWRSTGEVYTAEIFNVENAVVQELAAELGLKVHPGYYHLDAIFYKEHGDRVHCAPQGQTWVQNIRIAFEHENHFNSGLFTETSHLLITRADLRVLVAYTEEPEETDLKRELKNLGQIIATSDLSADPAFLFIVGKRIDSQKDIEWRAFTFEDKQLQPLA
jgi:hypothetical protein